MKENLEIRMATVADAKAIAAVLAQSFAEYEPLYTAEAFAATTPDSRTIKNRFGEGEMWVAVLEGEIVGTVSVVPEKVLYIRSMAVLPAARGNRIGERLLKEIEKYAVSNGYRRLTLCTTPFLDRAIKLYEKFGFARRGSADLFGTPILTMEKSLEYAAGFKRAVKE